MSDHFIQKTATISSICILLTLIITVDLLSAQQVNDQTHRVDTGETLFSISRLYDIPVSDLRSWNELETDNLQPGQELRLTPPLEEERTIHRVEAGESLFAISRMYNVTIAEIQQWNNLDNTALEAGSELVIYQSEVRQADQTPPPSISEMEQMAEEERTSIVRQMEESGSNSESYLVRSGDTLYQIARDHNMTVNELRQLNNLTGDMLRVGQRIMVRRVRTAPSVAEGAENSTPQGKFTTYRVQRGDTFQELLRRFKMSESELMALNPGMNRSTVAQGQQLTILLPPSRNFNNPYRKDANLEDLGTVPVTRYQDMDRSSPTTSGELYNPEQLTAAHSNMALGNVIYIENPSTNKGVFVRVNDRQSGDGLKLSHKAFEMLQFSTVEQPMVTIYLDN